MSSIAIIPARGGSKRIPGKNIKDFLGRPIIAYSIEVALESGLFDEVMVSTDDEEIAGIARQYGAKVPFYRSADNANDFATLNDVITEIKDHYDQSGKYFESGCCILPTAPLICIEDMEAAYRMMIDKEFNSVRPIVRYDYPIQRALRYRDGAVAMINASNYNVRSQDLETCYHDAGQFYWFKMEFLLKGDNKGGLIIDSFRAQDIDNMDDWLIAEKKYTILKG